MYALFVRLDDPPVGVEDETVYLFDNIDDAYEWAFDVLENSGLVVLRNGQYGDEPLGEFVPWPAVTSKDEAVCCWADTLHADEYFHIYEVVDKRHSPLRTPETRP